MEVSMERRFEAAVEIVQNMPKTERQILLPVISDGPIHTDNNEKLAFYSLYKQASCGPCNVPAPSFWQLIEKYKWEAWKSLGEMSKEEAMDTYVLKIQKKIDQVNEQYDIMQWLSGPDFDRLEPILRQNFKLIDRELVSKDGIKKSEESAGEENAHNEEKSEKAQKSSYPPEEEHEIAMEGEYYDAKEEGIHDSVSGLLSVSLDINEDDETTSLRVSCFKIQMELRAIKEAVLTLSESLQQRHNSMMKLMKSSAFYISIPSKMSWKTFIFFLLWPFFVNFISKYFGYNGLY